MTCLAAQFSAIDEQPTWKETAPPPCSGRIDTNICHTPYKYIPKYLKYYISDIEYVPQRLLLDSLMLGSTVVKEMQNYSCVKVK